MSRERYQRVKEVFLEVCDLTDADRVPVLDRECGDDASLRAEVESMLVHHDPTEPPAEGAVADEDPPADTRSKNLPNVGPYRILREIGRGGMGAVYLAERSDGQINRRVAIKIMKRGMETEDVLARFDLERQLLASLSHPGVAQLYEVGETSDGMPYFVMEYIEGLPIGEYCDVHRLRIDERLALFRKVCAAVHHAHQNLVVHRDLKPSNIMVTEKGEAKLLDFGIAKVISPAFSPMVAAAPTSPEYRVMTPEYASPEQVRGLPITTATDIYSLGVILYELVCGHRPYRLDARVREEIERLVCEQEPHRPSTAVSRIETPIVEPDAAQPTTPITPESVSRAREARPERLRKQLAGDIDNIIFMAMRKEPQRRYASAEQFAEDLHRHLSGMPVIARPDTLGYRIGKFAQRNRAGVVAGIAILVLLIAGIAGTSWGWAAATRARTAETEQRRAAEAASARLASIVTANLDTVNEFLTGFDDEFKQAAGTTQARQKLTAQAMENLQRVREEIGDEPEVLASIALAYSRIGDISGGIRNPNLGDTAGALDSYEAALEIREALAAAAPDDAERQRALHRVHTRMGDALKNTEILASLDRYRQAIAICERLASREDADDADRVSLATATMNVGDALAATGDLVVAREHYQRSLEIRERLAAKTPEDVRRQRQLCSIYLRIADAREKIGDTDAVLELHERAVALRKRVLATDPDNARFTRDLAVQRYFAGRTRLRLGRLDEARVDLEAALATSKELADADAADARARTLLAAMHEIVGGLHVANGAWDDALTHYRASRQAALPLWTKDPENAKTSELLAAADDGAAEALAARGDLAGAALLARRAVETISAPADRNPSDTDLQMLRADVQRRLGMILAESDPPPTEAFQHLDAAQLVYARVLHDRDTAPVREELARTLLELAKLAAKLDDTNGAQRYAEAAISKCPDAPPDLANDLARYRR